MKILSFIFLLASAAAGYSYTVNGTVYTTDGSVVDANNAEAACTSGDTIVIPPGTFTWGTGNVGLGIYKGISVLGSGTGQTFIVCDPSCTLGAMFPLTTSGTVGNFTFVSQPSLQAAFGTTGTSGWRITNINYDAATNNSGSYFCVVSGNYGLIDNCNISLGTVDSELIFGRGPGNSWQTPSSMGTQNCVIIENCTFNTKNVGYLTDANANARYVVRFCTITGMMWIDGHGLASNTPARGVRHMEIYGNTWTSNATAGGWQCMDLRGGSGMVFNNSVPNSNEVWILFNEYGCQLAEPNYDGVYQTPYNYPIPDQIGVGEDIPYNGPGNFVTSNITYPAGYQKNAGGSAPYYLWNDTLMGSNFTVTDRGVTSGAIAEYASQVGGSGSFTMIGPTNIPSIIQEGRDFFMQGGLSGTAAFNGTDGVGVGTTAQMNAITPTVNHVGFWVTDQGSWNTTLPPNTSGEFFVWTNPSNGNPGFWGDGTTPGNPYYVPYTYPDPQITGYPSVTGTTGGTGTTGSTGGGTSSSGGWVSTNGVWTFSPYAPASPATVPPAPTNLQVTGT